MAEIFTIGTRQGQPIPLRTVGRGPGLVVVHGAAVSLTEYARLADALADRFTVHLYNRRGRPGAAPLDPATYSLDTELADLADVLAHTGARLAFGHSGGGFVVLRAAVAGLPLDRIAVYDPGLLLSGRPSYAFVDAFAAAIAAGDLPRAMLIMNRGVYPGSASARLPTGLQLAVGRAFLRTSIGRRFADLLPTAPPEIREIVRHGGPPADYAGITAEVLLAAGARSPGYFAENCRALAEAIPNSRAVTLPGAPHNAPNVAGRSFVRLLGDFFSEPATTSR